MVADYHSILARCRNYFSQLLNVRGINGVRQTEELHPAQQNHWCLNPVPTSNI
jgi:hypothetical protein